MLHYAQEIFEGLKAYRHADGSVWAFRPDQNAARFQRSARRLALPEPAGRGLHRVGALARRGRPRLGAGRRRRREEPLPAAVHVRLRGLPRRAPRGRDHLLRHRLAGRRVLRRRRAAGVAVAVAGVQPGRRGRHRRREVRRQLRLEPAAAARGRRARLRPGGVPRRRRAPLGRGASGA
nr:hypothetical protein [Angustibacter aerolatus]